MIKVEKEYKNWLRYHFRHDNIIRYAGVALGLLGLYIEASDVVTPIGSAKSNILLPTVGLAFVVFGPDIVAWVKAKFFS
jgi:hypothetical protein